MVKKMLGILLASVLLISLFSGCGGAKQNATKSSEPYAGVTLDYITCVHPQTDFLKAHLSEFTKATGINVNIETYATDQMSNKITVASAAKSSSLDLIYIRPLQETKLYTQNGWVVPIDSYANKTSNYDLKDFEPSLASFVSNGKTYGIPFTTEREILYYRKDIFAKNNLQPPKTLEEMMLDASILNDPKNGFYGFVARGLKNINVTAFSNYLHSFGGDFQNANGDVATINSPAAIMAYKYYGDMLRNYAPPGAINMSWTDAAAIFAQGKVAMFPDADSIYLNVADPTKSTVAAQVGYAVFPAGTAGAKPYNVCSGGIGISSFSKNKDASWEFIAWASSKDIVLRSQAAGNPGGRQSVWLNPKSAGSLPKDLISVINKSMAIGVAHDRPTLIAVSQARDIISEPLTAAIEGNDVTSAANQANKEFQALLDSEKVSK